MYFDASHNAARAGRGDAGEDEGLTRRWLRSTRAQRFTEKAIKVVMLAQEEARRLGHNFVGTEQVSGENIERANGRGFGARGGGRAASGRTRRTRR